MNIIQKFFRAAAKLIPGIPISNSGVYNMFVPGGDQSSPYVTPEQAQSIAAVYAAVGIYSRTIASIPLTVKKRTKNGGLEDAVDFYLYDMLKWKPCKELNSFEWREMLEGHTQLRGNSYAFKVLQGDGRIRELIPLHPDRIFAQRAVDGRLFYTVQQLNDAPIDVPPEWILHIRNRTDDGIYGLSPLSLARRTFNVAISAEKFGEKIYKNNARLGGILKHPGRLNEDSAKRIRESFDALYSGAENAGRTAVFEEGLEWQSVSMSATDAQFLESREFSVRDIARWFNLPPHRLGDMARSTFTNMEQQDLEFLNYSLRSAIRRWEFALNSSLLTDQERKKYVIEYDLSGEAKGDVKTRFESYSIGRNWGFYSANDVRKMEHMNPIENGDIYLQPVNTVEAGTLPSPQPPNNDPNLPPQPASDQQARAAKLIGFDLRNQRERHERAAKRMFQDAISRILVKESRFIEHVAKKCAKERDLGDLRKQITDFYSDHPTYCFDLTKVPALATAEGISDIDPALEKRLEDRLSKLASAHCTGQRNSILAVTELPHDQILEKLSELSREWIDQRFAILADVYVTAITELLEAGEQAA